LRLDCLCVVALHIGITRQCDPGDADNRGGSEERIVSGCNSLELRTHSLRHSTRDLPAFSYSRESTLGMWVSSLIVPIIG
jgi:hypothetical protein